VAPEGKGGTGQRRLVALASLIVVIIAAVGAIIDAAQTTPKPRSARSLTSLLADDPFLRLGLKNPTGQAPGASGIGMPTSEPPGYSAVFADDFPASEDVKPGQFSGCVWRGSIPKSVCTGLPDGARSRWWAYPGGARDTSGHGTYEPSQVLTIAHGILSFHLHTSSVTGRPVVAAVEPKVRAADNPQGSIRFGAYAVRFRVQNIPGYELEFQLFPNGNRWPKDGSIALPAGYTGSRIEALLHWYGARKVFQQDIFSRANNGQWHTAVVQWGPSRVVFLLDGNVMAIVRTHVPERALHLVLQTQTGVLGPAPAPTAAGTIDVAWLTEYKRDLVAPVAVPPTPAP
jgi:hypothetical protein